MTQRLGKRTVRGSLWLFLVNLVSKGSQVVVTLALAALLTEEDLGLVALAVAVVNIGQVVQSMGVYDLVSRTRRDPRAMAGTLLALSAGTGVVLALALLLAAGPVAAALGTPAAAPLVRLVAVSLPFTAAGGVQLALVHRDLDFRRRLLPDSGSAVLGAAVTVALAVAGAGPYSPAIGLLCAAVAQPVLAALVGVRPRPGWDRGCAVEAVRWIAVVGPAAVVAVLLVNADYLAIGHVLGPGAVGVYSLAYRIAWVPYIVVAVVLGGVAFPLCARLVRDGRRADLPSAVGRFTHAVLVLTGGLYAVVALLADRVVVLGQRWAPAAGPLFLLCGYGLGLSLLHVWGEALRAAGHARAHLALAVAHLVVLTAGLASATRFGVLAVAAVQVAAVWSLVPVAWWVLARRGLAPPPARLVRMARGVLLAACCCAALSFVLDGWFAASAGGAVVEGFVLVLGYAAAVLVTDRDAVRELREVRR
ncbi:oligosaccharide flippase family protein [Saccharothrix coeruleofusca]|uniref:Polysaccharide biosynthesis protein n=1 Tax=Saccharothrix coeruleofusca TaxID=33919 RepID=A0A918AS03_9PSEU|nr:oligosaccharide flippase family protein [Saccharothrix coeruleofusca]MBP2335410.1 PST family polysaccharide transporter [Saccharothrix coeruleofusca]GGP77654.1 polysaccharide biosynthesis protein [Saccharothrix coeruleofusca]